MVTGCPLVFLGRGASLETGTSLVNSKGRSIRNNKRKKLQKRLHSILAALGVKINGQLG